MSVIIPTHDRDQTLDLTIASIQAQTVSDIEIIIAGDGVTFAVRAVLERLCALDKRIRFLDFEKAAGRGYENRHRALLASTGEYIFYSDDDDLWLPDHVEKLSKALSAAEVVDSAVVSIARSGRIHRSFANHSYPAQRQLLASTGERKILFDTHFAHRRSLYLRLGDVWLSGVADLLSKFAASDAIWATLNEPTALSLHGSVRSLNTPLQRREEAMHVAAGISRLDVEREATSVWYLYRMMERQPPAKSEALGLYLQRMGVDRSGVGDGDFATGTSINPLITSEALADMEMTFGLFQRDLAAGAPVHRILLPLVEPLLGGAARVRHFARVIGKALPEGPALKVVSDILTDRPHDVELKALLRAQLLLMQRHVKDALPPLEEGARVFSRYAPDAILMLARHATREGMNDEGIRRLRDAVERFSTRSDVRLALANSLWRAGQTGEAIDLLEGNPGNEDGAELLAKMKEGSQPSPSVVHQQADESGAVLEGLRAAFERREWRATVSCFERLAALSKVGKGRRVEAVSLTARAYVALNDRAAARKLLRNAADTIYDKPQHYEFLVLAFVALKNYREASKYCLMADQLALAGRGRSPARLPGS